MSRDYIQRANHFDLIKVLNSAAATGVHIHTVRRIRIPSLRPLNRARATKRAGMETLRGLKKSKKG